MTDYGMCQHHMLVVCAGVWATLQFKWVQLQYPVVVLAFEKLLLGACLPVAATVQAWGVIAALGLAIAPFCLALILAGLYCLLALPLPSSFAGSSRKQSIGTTTSPMLLLLTPASVVVPTGLDSLNMQVIQGHVQTLCQNTL